MIRLSYDTILMLCDLGDREAWDIRELEWDMENTASRKGGRRLDFHYFSREGQLKMEARSRYPY